MPVNDGTEPVEEQELLYRRIPVSMGWFDAQSRTLSPHAFEPREGNGKQPGDVDGISVTRAKYATIADASRGSSRKGYYVAVLRAGDLYRNGIHVAPAPESENPGHALITSLTVSNVESDRSNEIMVLLATQLCLEVSGPFIPNVSC